MWRERSTGLRAEASQVAIFKGWERERQILEMQTAGQERSKERRSIMKGHRRGEKFRHT